MNKPLKHTPAPWCIQIRFPNHVFGNGRLVAGCGGYTSNVGRELIIIENKANTALIAAAPDLLAALQACVDALDRVLQCDTSDTHFNQVETARDSARQAIDRATGQT